MGLRQSETIKTAFYGYSATRLRRRLGCKSLNLGLKSIFTKGPNTEHRAPKTKNQKPSNQQPATST
jgi:hypothetical protein